MATLRSVLTELRDRGLKPADVELEDELYEQILEAIEAAEDSDGDDDDDY